MCPREWPARNAHVQSVRRRPAVSQPSRAGSSEPRSGRRRMSTDDHLAVDGAVIHQALAPARADRDLPTLHREPASDVVGGDSVCLKAQRREVDHSICLASIHVASNPAAIYGHPHPPQEIGLTQLPGFTNPKHRRGRELADADHWACEGSSRRWRHESGDPHDEVRTRPAWVC